MALLYFTAYLCQDVPSPQLEPAWLLQQEQVCHEAGRREEDCKMGEKRTEEGSTQINYTEIYHVLCYNLFIILFVLHSTWHVNIFLNTVDE